MLQGVHRPEIQLSVEVTLQRVKGEEGGRKLKRDSRRNLQREESS
jgi:hypothetical protein